MVTGVRFFYETGVFPRYKYFQEHLLRLIPRFERVIEKGKLSTCISQGVEKLNQIIVEAEVYKKPLSVAVFADDVSVIKSVESQIVEASELEIKKKLKHSEQIIWTSYQEETTTVTDIVVCVVPREEALSSFVGGLQSCLLTKNQLHNMIIYNEQTGTCFLYSELEEANVKVNWESLSGLKLSISLQIQQLLESHVVNTLKQIHSYSSKFPVRDAMLLEKSLLDDVNEQVKRCLQDKYVIEDLSPELQLEKTAKMSQTDLGKHIEQDDYPSIEEDSIKITKFPQQLPDKIDSDTEEKFKTNIIEYMSSKTKCIVCDYLAQKCGLTSSLVNEFLNEGFYGYAIKFEKLMRSAILVHWPQISGREAKFKYFIRMCITNISKIVHETEEYIQKKFGILTTLAKMEFEIFGLLKHAKSEIHKEIPKLPLQLQLDLLDFPEVVGCGTVYGKLTVHVTKNVLLSRRKDIRELLHLHSYFHGFTIEHVSDKQEQHVFFGNGSKIRARLTEEGLQEMRTKYPDKDVGEYKYGSLGCCVIDGNNDLYCLTCAHCLYNCHDEVEVNTNDDDYMQFGCRTMYRMYACDVFDIAAIKVNGDAGRFCEKALPKSCGMLYSTVWRLLDGDVNDISGIPVYKNGCITNLTNGIITSGDYMTRDIKVLLEKSTIREPYNILIDLLPDQTEKLLFHPRCGSQVAVKDSKAHRPIAVGDCNNSVVLTNRPLQSDEVFEVCITEMDNTKMDNTSRSIMIGLTHHAPENFDFPPTMTDNINSRTGTWLMTEKYVLCDGRWRVGNYGRTNLNTLQYGDKVGVVRTVTGDLHFLVNGVDQGVAAVDIPEHLYGVVDLCGRAAMVTIIEQKKVFSEPGDSGSLVCTVNPDDLLVVAISLLQGTLYDPNKIYKYSYSCHLKRNLDVLHTNFGCNFNPACSHPSQVADQ